MTPLADPHLKTPFEHEAVFTRGTPAQVAPYPPTTNHCGLAVEINIEVVESFVTIHGPVASRSSANLHNACCNAFLPR
jgi:hypothetical protein